MDFRGIYDRLRAIDAPGVLGSDEPRLPDPEDKKDKGRSGDPFVIVDPHQLPAFLEVCRDDASLELLARTSSDLAWDDRRRLFWVLAGYVDRTPEGEWIIGREVYRYDPDGNYRGSLMLPDPAVSIATSPDGRFWTVDAEGIVQAFRVTDPDTRPAGN